MKRLISIIIVLLITMSAVAQMFDPVSFTVQMKTSKTSEAEIIFTGKIDEGWHVYSTDLGNNGPISATFKALKMTGVTLVGKLVPRGHEISNFDKMFGMKLRYFEKNVQFVQKIKFTSSQYTIDAYLEYGVCNDETCLPPTRVDFKKEGKSPVMLTDDTKEKQKEKEQLTALDVTTLPAKDSSITDIKDSISEGVMPAANNINTDSRALWKPVVDQLNRQNGNLNSGESSLLYIFLMGLLGGIIALFTPCVWPIIPMTVSFFLKRTDGNRTKSIRDAITYGVSIIVIYLSLGLLITGIYGANKLNALATDAVFNIFLFILIVVFALSFFGWFELRLPDKWANAVDSKATKTTGLISIFLMAFTLALVSFSCTGPIIGFLLVDFATSHSIMAPAVGMFGFAFALAFPFTFFALFPSLIKRAPKSGSWMNILKVSLGFVELAFALKFLSVADLAYGWHILDREVFLSLWIVIFGALGLYLIGKLKFQSDTIGGDTNKPMPVPCIMAGLCSIAFAVYMVPGLWGAPCKAISAFAPPLNTQDFNLNTKEVHPAFTNYEEGMAAAKAAGKPVLLDFTGFGCVNCRKMEAAVWTDPQVADLLTKDYVLISLFVDDKTPLRQPEAITLKGKSYTLRTVGDKWSYLQASKFGANAQPFYVPLDNEGNPLNGSYAYKEDIAAYLQFLQKGLEVYRSE